MSTPLPIKPALLAQMPRIDLQFGYGPLAGATEPSPYGFNPSDLEPLPTVGPLVSIDDYLASLPEPGATA